jgi:hypothetical protein
LATAPQLVVDYVEELPDVILHRRLGRGRDEREGIPCWALVRKNEAARGEVFAPFAVAGFRLLGFTSRQSEVVIDGLRRP